MSGGESRGSHTGRRLARRRGRGEAPELTRHRRLQVAVLYPESSHPDSAKIVAGIDPIDRAGDSPSARGDEARTAGWSADAYGYMLRALQAEGFDVVEVGIGFDTLHRLDDLTCDVAVNLCDGCTLDGEPGV